MRRIPGMLHILISFIPWITYWILCSRGVKFGVIASLIISSTLVIFRIYKKDLNLMDLTSITYFSLASIGAYFFNLNMFVEKSVVLGYFALFLMALFSLSIKQPFTLQVSRKDYPRVYWEDKMFLLINNVITGIWALIFIANSTVHLLLMKPLAAIISNTLIVLGVLFSIFFPLKAIAYFVLKEFKKYDWRVKVYPQKPKEKNEYDVIIVGSGIGGLTCGALLSKRGYKVLVLEQHYLVGGYCSSFRRRNFIFNVGVSDVSGLWEKGPVTYLLKELGLRKEDFFVRNTVKYIYKGVEIEAKNLKEFMETLSKMFPEEAENIYAFFDEAKKAYEECYMEAETYGVPLPAELIAKVFGGKKLLQYPKEHPHFYDWLKKTYKQKLDEYFRSSDLKSLLCALIGYVGLDPSKVPASSALTAVVSYYIYGGYFPKGGAQHFANALKKYIEDHGGKVLVNHRVDKILVEKGKVKGVKVGNKVFKAPIVVANANAKVTFLKLIDKEHLEKKFIDYIRSLRMSFSCFAVYLGVNMDLSQCPSIIVDLDKGYYIVINSNADPDLAPPGKASITIITPACYHDFPERETEEYLKKKRELTDELIKKAEEIIPNLREHIVVQDAATPKTFERYTLTPEGAIYAFDQSIDVKRPYFKTPIKGLYLAGASTFPGGGVEAVVISGIICANDICNWVIHES